MLTLEEAKALKLGTILYHTFNRNVDGSPQRWTVNGKVKTWKKNPKRVLVPVKYSLYNCDSLDAGMLHLLSLTEKGAKGMTLNILTPYGDHYKIEENGNIIRTDIKDFEPSGNWKFLGMSHVKRNHFIPFKDITEEFLKDFNPCWKNGTPQYTVRDLDHGTMREWGNTKHHGIKRIWFS